MSIHASPAFALANKTFTSSLDAFGLRRPASGPVDHDARHAAADAFLDSIDTSDRIPKESSGSRRHIFDVDFPTTAPLEPATGPNSVSLGTRRRGPRTRANATSQPPPEVIAIRDDPLASSMNEDTAPAALPFSLTQPVNAPQLAFSASAPPSSVPISAFMVNPDVPRPPVVSAFPPAQTSAVSGTSTSASSPASASTSAFHPTTSNVASAFSAFNSNANSPATTSSSAPSTSTSAFASSSTSTFATNSNSTIKSAFATDASAFGMKSNTTSAFGIRKSAFATNGTTLASNTTTTAFPSSASAFGLSSTRAVADFKAFAKHSDIDDDAMDTTPDSHIYYKPPAFSFVVNQFARRFQPFVPPPLHPPPPPPRPTQAPTLGFIQRLEASLAAQYATSSGGETSTAHCPQRLSAHESIPPPQAPIMDEIIKRNYTTADTPVSQSLPPRKDNPLLAPPAENRRLRFQERREAARRGYCQAERREYQRQAELLERQQRRSRRCGTWDDLPHAEIPPCMLPERTRKMLATMAAETRKVALEKKTSSERLSRRCHLTEVGPRLLSAACSAPRIVRGFL
ncbi:uncharacterized protein SCHCODRAFT_02684211 [Schizophyllum commune H4-8]|nr:uncharacterized protein SCHCODRAFT_02684211 [Schizophyllum commune H4-8]KAI5897936.1 hypothetical protein SCHCODRAFT_02684211 [Schizophyllum commune H4-8]